MASSHLLYCLRRQKSNIMIFTQTPSALGLTAFCTILLWASVPVFLEALYFLINYAQKVVLIFSYPTSGFCISLRKKKKGFWSLHLKSNAMRIQLNIHYILQMFYQLQRCVSEEATKSICFQNVLKSEPAVFWISLYLMLKAAERCVTVWTFHTHSCYSTNLCNVF